MTLTMPQTKVFKFSTIKQVNRDNREIEFVASKEETDRDNEVIVVRGIDLSNFRKNPVMLLQHDPRTRFGRVDGLRVERIDGVDALLGRASVLPFGINPEVDQAYQEMLHGSLNGISIGFLVKDRRGPKITKSELLEISLVSLPSCASCTVTGKQYDNIIEIDDEIFMNRHDTEYIEIDFDEPREIEINPEDVKDILRNEVFPHLRAEIKWTVRKEVEKGIRRFQGKLD